MNHLGVIYIIFWDWGMPSTPLAPFADDQYFRLVSIRSDQQTKLFLQSIGKRIMITRLPTLLFVLIVSGGWLRRRSIWYCPNFRLLDRTTLLLFL